jgi:hypothetical protein
MSYLLVLPPLVSHDTNFWRELVLAIFLPANIEIISLWINFGKF